MSIQQPKAVNADRRAWLKALPLLRLWLGFRIGLGAALVLLLLWQLNLFSDWRLGLSNIYYTEKATQGNIVIIATDDASLQAYGRSLTEWPRSLYADLIRLLDDSGARVAVFDILFAEPSPDDDRLALAIEESRASDNGLRTVMPVVGVESNGLIARENQAAQFLKPIPRFADAVDYLGATNVVPDSDGAVRWQTMTMHSENEVYDSLSAVSYLAYLRIPQTLRDRVVSIEDGHLLLTPQRRLPIDDGRMMVNYFGTPNSGTFPVYSFKDVVEGNVPLSAFQDRVVFIGLMNSVGQSDQQLVPIGIGGAQMAGVEIHANTLETIMQELAPRPQPPLQQGVMILILALMAALIYANLPRRAIIFTFPVAIVLLLMVLVLAAALTFTTQLIVINLFDALLAVVIPAPGIALQDYLIEARLRRRAELLRESIVQASSQNLSMADTLSVIAHDLSKILGCETVQIWLRDENSQSMILVFPPSDATVSTDDFDPDFDETYRLDKEKMLMPFYWRDEMQGMIEAYPVRRIPRSLEPVLKAFLWQSTSMIVNVQLYAHSERLNDTKTRMIRMASHDLKNPLGVITGYLELLLDDVEDPALPQATRQKFLNQINRASKEMLAIVSNILDLERARRGSQAYQSYNLSSLLTELTLYFENKAERKSQRLDMQLPEAPVILVGDEKQMHHVFSNLIDNALKYTPEGGHIMVRLSSVEGNARVEVEDNGFGIPKESQKNLFQEFYRVRTSDTANIQGTGLGLSLVKAVVVAHKGRISVDSEEGKGSTFIVELPLASE